MSAVVLRSKRAARRESAAGAKAAALRTRGKPVSDNRKASGRHNCTTRLKAKPRQSFYTCHHRPLDIFHGDCLSVFCSRKCPGYEANCCRRNLCSGFRVPMKPPLNCSPLSSCKMQVNSRCPLTENTHVPKNGPNDLFGLPSEAGPSITRNSLTLAAPLL
jgi:hypothetical protein